MTPIATRTLLVIDDTADPDSVRQHLGRRGPVDLFPLTSNWGLLESVVRVLRRISPQVRVLDAARELDREVQSLRQLLPTWSTRVGETRVDGRTVKEWLNHPSGDISAFWFGSIAEKNSLKTPEFFVVAQIRTLDRLLSTSRYDECVHLLGTSLIGRALTAVARARGLQSRGFRGHAATSLWIRMRAWLSQPGRARARLLTLLLLLRFAVWGALARGLTLRRVVPTSNERPVMFVTYFPYVDRERAATGVFSNRYAQVLQALFAEQCRPVWWVGLFVFIDGWSFRDAVRMARRFVRGGERLALIEAYCTPACAFRVLRDWVMLTARARRVRRRLAGQLGAGLVPEAAEMIVDRLWTRSYQGPDLIRGLYYYECFRRLMDEAAAASVCLYYCEMQAWEHALNAAARARSAPLPTVGLQHTSVSRNYLFYTQTPAEMNRRTTTTMSRIFRCITET